MSLVMHCEPCGKQFSGPVSYSQHIVSDKHKRKVSNLNLLSNLNDKKTLSNASYVLPSSSLEHSRDPLECSTCSLKFNSFEDLQTHSLSIEHAKRIIENAQMRIENAKNMESQLTGSSSPSDNVGSNSIEDLTEQAKRMIENTQMRIENVENMERQFIGSSAHTNNVGSNLNEISDKSDTILPEVQMFKSQASFSFCDTCKKSFSGPENYKQHIESAGHIKKMELEKKVSLGINVAASEFSCAPCKKTFSGIVPYDQHMNSLVHKKKIDSLKLLEKYEVDSSSKVNMPVLEPSPFNKENPLYCKTCDIICSGTASFEQHIKGITHLKHLLKAAEKEKGTQNTVCSSLQINGLNMPKEDIILPGLMDNNEDARNAKLDELITMFLPEEEIDFDEQNNETDLKLAEPVEKIDSDEQNNKTTVLKSSEPIDQVDSDGQKNKTSLKSVEPVNEIHSDGQKNKTSLKLAAPEKVDFEEQNKTNLKIADRNSDESELIQDTLNVGALTIQGKENILEIQEDSDVYQICKVCNVKLYSKDEALSHFESLEHFQKKWV